jgi:predicted RNase H-like HicB family nuclease
MDMYTYPITSEREGRRYWAYSKNFPGVYGLRNSIEEAKNSILESIRLCIEERAGRAAESQRKTEARKAKAIRLEFSVPARVAGERS